jgi:hypothetical protein
LYPLSPPGLLFRRKGDQAAVAIIRFPCFKRLIGCRDHVEARGNVHNRVDKLIKDGCLYRVIQRQPAGRASQ